MSIRAMKGGKTAQIHPAKAIYARITFPQRMRRERGGACAYLISRTEAVRGCVVEGGGGWNTDGEWALGSPLCPDALITVTIST